MVRHSMTAGNVIPAPEPESSDPYYVISAPEPESIIRPHVIPASEPESIVI